MKITLTKQEFMALLYANANFEWGGEHPAILLDILDDLDAKVKKMDWKLSDCEFELNSKIKIK